VLLESAVTILGVRAFGLRAEENRKRGEQLGTVLPEFFQMDHRELPEGPIALGGNLHPDLALVARVAVPADHPQKNETVYEFNHAMVLMLQLSGEGQDGRGDPIRETPNGEEELMLLGLKPGATCSPLAEHEEAPDQIANPGKRTIVRLTRLQRMVDHRAILYRITI
jgi:hypothetical protein